MPLIDGQTYTEQQKVVKHFKDTGFSLYRKSRNRYEHGLERFWKHPSLTPQEVSDALGTNAGDLITLLGALRTFVLTLNPGANLTPPTAYGTWTVNPDGTVTINSVNQ